METSIILATIAGILHIVAYSLYAFRSFRGLSEPNVVSWSLWGLLTILNVTSYRMMSGDWVKSIQPLAGSFMCILTATVVIYRGSARFKKLSTIEWVAAIIGLAAIVLWKVLHSPIIAQVLVLSAVGVGFITTFKSVWRNPSGEWKLPWFIWAVAFTFGLVAAVMRMKGWQDLIYYIECLPLHLAVGLLAMRKIVIAK